MEYIDVLWLHAHENEPVRLISELDHARFETRKLEFYTDGRIGWADGEHEVLGSILGETSVPALVEINADPQFVGRSISAAEFEELWSTHCR